MAINPPVDATKTPEWAALQKHYDELQSEGISLKQWFADDAERVEKLSFDAGDLHFDLSKNLIKPETLQLFADLAKAVKLDERTKAMYTGVHINNTEDRAVLHTALRRPAEDEGKYIVDGQDTVKDVREVLGRIYAFADKVRSGEWTGVSGKKIETVVNIGIGGSDLGPVMVYEALKPYADAGISARYISNIDPNDLAEKTKGLDPETTLFIVVSKTFTTLETLTNAREARTWLLDALKAAGAVDAPTRRTPKPSRSTSSPSPPTWRRSLSSASTRPTPSASGTGLAAATPWTQPSAPPSPWCSDRNVSKSSCTASMRSTNTSPTPRSRRTWSCCSAC